MLFINHEKKAIFLHIPKTAGTYIEDQLTAHYGFTSYKYLLMGRRPDHDIICKTDKVPKVLTNIKIYNNTWFNKLLGLLVYCKTSDYINKETNMDEEKWKTYTKFCFIRNPYDRALSGWAHMKALNSHCLPFERYIHQNKFNVSDIEYAHVFLTQKTQIQDVDGTCGVDIIGRFEHLEEDFCKILNTIGFNKIVHTPKKMNVSRRFKSDQIALSKQAIKKLNILFNDDLNMFHYKRVL